MSPPNKNAASAAGGPENDANAKLKRSGFYMNRLLVRPVESVLMFICTLILLGYGLHFARDALGLQRYNKDVSSSPSSNHNAQLYLYRGQEADPVMEFMGDDAGNGQDFLSQTDSVRVVEFYNRWCGHCQSFVSKFIQLAKDYYEDDQSQTPVSFHAVSCAAHSDVCSGLGLSGSSSLQIFAKGDATPQPIKSSSLMGGFTLQDLQNAVQEVDFVSSLGGGMGMA